MTRLHAVQVPDHEPTGCIECEFLDGITREIRAEAAGSKEGIKWDDAKVRTDLLPINPILDIAQVLTFGANKYSDRNWELGFNYSRVYAALLRHVFAWWNGEDVDPETGYSHLAHAGCCLFFLLEFLHTGRGTDDRPNTVLGTNTSSLAHMFEKCPICDDTTKVDLVPHWENVVKKGAKIAIVGCGNPWHYGLGK